MDSQPQAGSVAVAPNLPDGFADIFSSRFVNVGDVRLHAVIGGDGPPLLLVHGWPQTWYAWRMVMPTLARDFTVIAVDQRGRGLSDKPRDGYDAGTLANDLVADHALQIPTIRVVRNRCWNADRVCSRGHWLARRCDLAPAGGARVPRLDADSPWNAPEEVVPRVQGATAARSSRCAGARRRGSPACASRCARAASRPPRSSTPRAHRARRAARSASRATAARAPSRSSPERMLRRRLHPHTRRARKPRRWRSGSTPLRRGRAR